MPTPPRRWFAFRLRTLLIVVAVLAVLCWIGQSLNWVRRRHLEVLSAESFMHHRMDDLYEHPTRKVGSPTTAPGSLWLFGEKGLSVFIWTPENSDIDECRRLFPEAEFVRAVPPGQP